MQAMHGLHSALSGSEAFVKFIGQPRTGKSGVCEKLAQFMRHKDYRVIYFDYAVESPDMLRSILAKELDIPDSFNMLRYLEDALVEESGKPLILIFDDAHQLSDITLIEIYRLAGVQVQQKRVINLVLCGEPELEKRLSKKKEFTPLLHHVSHNFLLQPMNAETTSHFLQAFLQKMEMPGLQLEPAAQNQFFKSCRGFPGPAHSLCQLVLSIRQENTELTSVTKDDLQRAIRSADSEQPVSSSGYAEGNRRMLLAPVAAVIVIASLALLMRQLNPAENAIEETPSISVGSSVESTAGNLGTSPFAADEISSVGSSGVASPSSSAVSVDVINVQSEPASVAVVTEMADVSIVEEPEIEETVAISDSNLALVTAQERGIAQEAITEPEFEQLATAVAITNAQPVSPATEEAAAVSDRLQIANVTLTRPMLALDEEEIDEIVPVNSENDRRAASEESALEGARVQSESASSRAGTAQAMVQLWVEAWQDQDLEQYFASYDAQFVPRYHRSRSAWRSNRERVIGNASQISLEVSDFEVVNEDAQSVEVHFWLAYRSPSYRDDTRKKLILRKLPATDELAERLVILEEINLEVRV